MPLKNKLEALGFIEENEEEAESSDPIPDAS